MQTLRVDRLAVAVTSLQFAKLGTLIHLSTCEQPATHNPKMTVKQHEFALMMFLDKNHSYCIELISSIIVGYGNLRTWFNKVLYQAFGMAWVQSWVIKGLSSDSFRMLCAES